MKRRRVRELRQGSLSKSLLILIVLLTLLSPSIATGKSYYIKEAFTEIKIKQDGLVQITERITYGLSGRFHYLGRTIPLKGLQIENLRASVKGAAASIKREVFPGRGIDITARISDDPENINLGVENKDVTLVVSYDLKGAVNLYQDIAEIFPKLWGEGWSVPVKRLRGEIFLPKASIDSVKYWVHPKDYLASEKVTENKISLIFEDIPPNQFIEVRLLMPKDWFENAKFAKRYNYPAIEKIEKIEMGYERKILLIKALSLMILIFAFAIPITIYLIWGREPKVSYSAPYEHEPPYPDPPSFVNAIMMGKIGIPTLEGFIASVLELVRNGHIRFKEGDKKEIYIELGEGNADKLPKPEKEVLDFLKKELKESGRSWESLKESWSKTPRFKEFFESWKDLVRWEVNPKRFFSDTGSKILKAYGATALILGILSIMIIISSDKKMFYPKALNFMTLSLGILSLAGLVSLLLPEQIGGRWTTFGRIYYMKWNAFKRFLSDFSLLKIHAPQSTAIWDRYLVYATALGIAEKTWKAMKFIVPRESLRESSFYPMWGFYPSWIGSFRSSLKEAYSFESGERVGKDIFSGFLGGSSGIGGIGGGFGGGGGKAG